MYIVCLIKISCLLPTSDPSLVLYCAVSHVSIYFYIVGKIGVIYYRAQLT